MALKRHFVDVNQPVLYNVFLDICRILVSENGEMSLEKQLHSLCRMLQFQLHPPKGFFNIFTACSSSREPSLIHILKVSRKTIIRDSLV